jgi:galactokinase
VKGKVFVSTPSRICLFGEHQDYLGLEIIASAINLRFRAKAVSREDSLIHVRLSGEDINVEETIDISKPIVYENNRDYLKSAVNLLIRKGYNIKHGCDIWMDSDIPIGKGMCSSSTMVIVFIKALLEVINSEDKDDSELIARLGFEAEVKEFNEPGGMMDHYSSALGGLVHIKFNSDATVVNRINKTIPGSFILFDSLQDKDTTKVLANAKYPVLEALDELKEFGIQSVRDFVNNENNMKYLDKLDDIKRKKLSANIDNYRIMKEGKALLEGNSFSAEKLGELLKKHHANLRDGLGISTPKIEEILNTAYENGALGGKINGSGGGGCCYVYAHDEDCEKIVKAVEEKGYPGIIIKQDTGVRKDKEEII